MSNIYDGYPNGYNNEQKKHRVSPSAVVRIVIWSLVFCIVSGLFGLSMIQYGIRGGMGSVNLGGYWYDEDEFAVGNGTTRATVDEITIDWVSGSVTLVPTDGDELIISEKYDGEDRDDRLRWKVEDGELEVKFCKPDWIGADADAKDLTISVPAFMLDGMEEVHVTTVSGSQNIRISARDLEIDSVSGDVKVEGDYRSLSVETVSGTTTFAGTIREGDFQGVSGGVKIQLLKQADSLRMETVSGNMTLTLPESTTGFRVDTDSVSGNTNIRDFVFENGYSNKWGDGSMRIDMESVSGRLTVQKESKE